MKIHQLFVKKVDTELVLKMLECFGLQDFNDKKLFSRYDLVQHRTLEIFENTLKEDLKKFYLPCKSKMYLENLTEKRLITILKQVLRLHGYYLFSKEKNYNNKKIIFYQLINERDKCKPMHMKQYNITNILYFD